MLIRRESSILSLSTNNQKGGQVEKQFSAIMDKVDGFADNLGTQLNTKISKVVMWSFFTGAVVLFGFVTFSSKFIRSLFGLKD